MEILILIAVVWAISCTFPGSSSSVNNYSEVLASFLAGVIVIGAGVLYWNLSVAGLIFLGESLGLSVSSPFGPFWLIFVLLGPIALPMFASALWHARRTRK